MYTMEDEELQREIDIRNQYNQMMMLKVELNEKEKMLQLQIRENYILLINRKKSLYPGLIFGFTNFLDAINNVSNYFSKIEAKEIRRNTKCQEKTDLMIMMGGIKFQTGIEVKSIDKIVRYGVNHGFYIYFTDKKYGKKFKWYVPNLKHSEYCPRMYYGSIFGKSQEPNFDYILEQLDMYLYYIESETKSTTVLKTIGSFPNDIRNLKEFGERLDLFFENKEE